MVNLVILIGLALLVVFIVGKIVVGYSQATGSPWERLLVSAKNSATVLWSYIVAAAGMILTWADQAAQYFNMPEVQQFLKDNLTPTRLATAMTVIAAVTIVARLRTLQSK